MSGYVVDIRSKVIKNTQKIWVVHHGRNTDYYQTFAEQGLVFLEFPGLDVNENIIDDDASLRQRIRFAQAIRANRGYQRENGDQILLADFPSKPGSDVAVHLRTVKHLTSRIHAGDLIMVPSRGASGKILFGEAVGSFFPQQTVRAPGLIYAPTPIRKVRWLSEWNKTDLTPELVRYFEKPPAIAEVGRDQETEDFFDYAYDSYIMEGRSWVSVDAPGYDGKDFLSVVEPAQLLALGVALFRAHEANADIGHLSFEELINAYYDKSALADAKVAFSSPGHYHLKDKDARLAQFLSVFVALAMAGALTACSAGAAVTGTNSAAPDDPAAQAIVEMVQQASRPAGKDVLAKAEQKAAEAKKAMNLSVPAKVKK